MLASRWRKWLDYWNLSLVVILSERMEGKVYKESKVDKFLLVTWIHQASITLQVYMVLVGTCASRNQKYSRS